MTIGPTGVAKVIGGLLTGGATNCTGGMDSGSGRATGRGATVCGITAGRAAGGASCCGASVYHTMGARVNSTYAGVLRGGAVCNGGMVGGRHVVGEIDAVVSGG